MVDFKQDRAIYLQMAERICDEILAGKYHSDDRIPSVREQAVMFEVNTNTVVKTYDLLLQWGIIYTRRGLGYFVTVDALEKIKQTRSLKFMTENLPELFSQMKFPLIRWSGSGKSLRMGRSYEWASSTTHFSMLRVRWLKFTPSL